MSLESSLSQIYLHTPQKKGFLNSACITSAFVTSSTTFVDVPSTLVNNAPVGCAVLYGCAIYTSSGATAYFQLIDGGSNILASGNTTSTTPVIFRDSTATILTVSSGTVKLQIKTSIGSGAAEVIVGLVSSVWGFTGVICASGANNLIIVDAFDGAPVQNEIDLTLNVQNITFVYMSSQLLSTLNLAGIINLSANSNTPQVNLVLNSYLSRILVTLLGTLPVSGVISVFMFNYDGDGLQAL